MSSDRLKKEPDERALTAKTALSKNLLDGHVQLAEDDKSIIAPAPDTGSRPPSPTPTQLETSHEVDQTADTNSMGRTSPQVQVKKEEEFQLPLLMEEEGKPSYFSYVSLIKSENKGFSIWSVDAFNLGPTVDVPARYIAKGWTRKAISKAFGGNTQIVHHHFGSNATRTPFLTPNRTWHPPLPTPGMHGIAFLDIRDCPNRPEPINIFSGEGRNDWRLLGTYEYSRYGEIAPQQAAQIPGEVLDEWIQGFITKDWGKRSIASANEYIVDDDLKVVPTEASVKAALLDGRIVLPFTILKCVGYPMDWIRRLEEAEAALTKTLKRPAPKSKRNASKRVKKEEGAVKIESEGESDSGSDTSDHHSEPEEESRQTTLRRSLRKLKSKA
ncbi:hypothetical protein MIND_00452900 [Mycena indigotica]|uniref:DUF6697 domain-containing protein n=1 Tax=Mycena indigotica TaxID=2126181 RepID=A0A8H6SWV9_9AGAR|nr:uncharacterized protein MIND_00452900 [Mycena indigotica]KAF7306615.1 hypothetical protein MIND_00452900 [Mycena indigotica]